MIGRTEQLEQIMRAISSLAPGSSAANVLFVTGEAGIGKSTLLAAVREECARLANPPLVAITECSTPLAGQDIGEVESLQPWGELMAALVTARPEKRNETTKLVGELALAWVKVIPIVGDVIDSLADSTKILKDHFGKHEADLSTNAASQQQIFQQYINFLSRLADNGPLVLIIDDVHWADTASTNLLFAAARQLHGRPVLFILAYRPDDAASSRGGEGHPLIHVRNELERYDLAVDVGVPKLTLDETAALLTSRFPRYERDEKFETWLVNTSSGNALFISQFLHTLEEDGYIDSETGAPKDGYESIRVPSSAQAVVKERIRRLSEDAREMLRYASVEGDTFTSLVLARITELPQLKLLQRLRLLEETHRIIRSLGKQKIYARETTSFQFSHVLLQKAMYDDLGEEERELLHEAVLDVLKEEWETARGEGINVEGIAARLAVHARVLKQHAFAAEILITGAAAAWTEFAADETLRLAEDALQELALLSGPAAKKPETFRMFGEAQMVRARVLRTCARYSDAIAASNAALEAFKAAGDKYLSVDALNNLARVQRQQGDDRSADVSAREALALAEENGFVAGAAEALTTIGHLYTNVSEFDKALDSYRRSLELAQREGSFEREAAALDSIGSVYDSLSQYDEARSYFEQSLAVLERFGDTSGVAHVQLNVGVLDYRFGELDTARALVEKALATFRAAGDVASELLATVNLGIIAIHSGDHAAALDYSHRSLDVARRIGDRRAEAAAYSNLGEVTLATKDIAAAEGHFLKALEIHSEINDREGEIIARINLADVYSQSGRPAEAREQADRALAMSSTIGSKFLHAMATGHLGYADKIAAEAADNGTRPALLESASASLRSASVALTEIGSPYADMWQQMLADIESRA